MSKFQEALHKMQLLDENGSLAVKGGFVALSMVTANTSAAGNVNVDVSNKTCICKCDEGTIVVPTQPGTHL